MELAACASGAGNAHMFAQLTGQDPYKEGLIGEFYLGRGKPEYEPIAPETDARPHCSN